jgi:hypothetical protein
MCAQAREKKNPIVKAMKIIVLLLPACATTTISQEEIYATIDIGPKKVTSTKSMPTTWKNNTFALLPICVTSGCP